MLSPGARAASSISSHRPVGADPVLGVGDAVAELAVGSGSRRWPRAPRPASASSSVGVGHGVAHLDEELVELSVVQLAGDRGEDHAGRPAPGLHRDLVAADQLLDQAAPRPARSRSRRARSAGAVVDPLHAGAGLAPDRLQHGREGVPGPAVVAPRGRRWTATRAPRGQVAALQVLVAADPAGPQPGRRAARAGRRPAPAASTKSSPKASTPRMRCCAGPGQRPARSPPRAGRRRSRPARRRRPADGSGRAAGGVDLLLERRRRVHPEHREPRSAAAGNSSRIAAGEHGAEDHDRVGRGGRLVRLVHLLLFLRAFSEGLAAEQGSAVDVQDLTADPGGVRAGQIADGRGDVGSTSPARPTIVWSTSHRTRSGRETPR